MDFSMLNLDVVAMGTISVFLIGVCFGIIIVELFHSHTSTWH